MKKDYTRAGYREDVANQYPQNVYRAVFGVMEPTTVEEIGMLAGDRGALEFGMVLANLSDREAEIIRSRYQKNKTLEEIANIYSLNRGRVRQIEAKALRKMRRPCVAGLLEMGLQAWLHDQVSQEAKRIADCEVPKRVHQELKDRLEWAEQHLEEREAEILTLALNGDPDPDPKAIQAENITVEEMDLSVRSYNCLKRCGVYTMADLINRKRSDMFNVRNMGRKSLEEIEQKMKEYGFEFKPEEVE